MQMIISLLLITLVYTADTPTDYDKTEKFCYLLLKVSGVENICDQQSNWNKLFTKITNKGELAEYPITTKEKDLAFYTAQGSKSTMPVYIKNKISKGDFDSLKNEVLIDIQQNSPNKKKIEEAIAGYHGCLKTKEYYVLNTYSIPLDSFLVDIKAIPVKEKAQRIKEYGRVFKGLLIKLARLHSIDEEEERSFFIQSIDVNTFGVDSDEAVSLETVNLNSLVIRDAGNLIKKLDIHKIRYSNLKLKLDNNGLYNDDQMMNINYTQLIEYFLDVVKKNIIKYSFSMSDCFSTRDLDHIFEVNNCPTFILFAMQLLPEDEFIALSGLLRDNDVKVEPGKVKLGIFHIFDIISKWGSDIEKYKADEVEFGLPDSELQADTGINNKQPETPIETDEEEPSIEDESIAIIKVFIFFLTITLWA